MPNYASQLGEAVGNAVEAEIQRIIQQVVEPYGLYVDVGGKRPGKRKGSKLLMVNDTGTQYQVERIELLLKTSEDEYHLKKFTSVNATMQYLFGLTTDIENVKGNLK